MESDSKKPATEFSTATMEKGLVDLKSELDEGIGSITSKLGDVFNAQSQTMEAVGFHGQHLATLSAELAALKIEVKEKDKVISKLTSTCTRMKRDVDENTKDRKNKNMVINGLPESPNENCLCVVVEFLKRLVPTVSVSDIQSAYRLGKKSTEGSVFNRLTMVRFKDVLVKLEVMKRKSSLRNNAQNKGIFCNDDLPEEKRRVRQKLREISKFAAKNGYDNVQVKGDKIWVDGKGFSGDELHLLPVSLQPENIAVRFVGNGIGFAGESAYLSNFYPCSVVMGKNFCSSEQAFQYTKSIICEREDASPYFLQVEDPSVIKGMGSKIFTTAEWEEKKADVMKCVLLSKFGQNLDLKAKLMATGTTPLYECTQSKYWGTGWLIDAPGWLKSSNFPGKNVLGKLLMEIRDNVGGSKPGIPTSEILAHCKGVGAPRDSEIEMDYAATSEPVVKDGSKDVPSTESLKVGDEIPKPVSTDGEDAGALSQTGDASGSNAVDEMRVADPETTKVESSVSIDLEQDGDVLSHDSISFSSSTYLAENVSFTRKSVTKPDGSLDTKKLMNWTLPKLDLSATQLHKGGHRNHSFNPTEEATAVSTPVLIAKNLRKFKQRRKSTNISFGDVSSKANMLAMMDKMLNK